MFVGGGYILEEEAVVSDAAQCIFNGRWCVFEEGVAEAGWTWC